MPHRWTRAAARAILATLIAGIAVSVAPGAVRAGLVEPPAYIDLVVTADTIACDGAASTLVTAVVYDAAFQPVADGTTVSFSVTNGSATPPSAQTAGGEAFATVLGAASLASGVTVDVAAGTAFSIITIDCAEFTGRIRGKVTDGIGTPIAGATVDAERTTNFDSDEGSAITAADGSYEIAGLIAGNYRVRADSSAHLIDVIEPVFVSTASITYGVDFSLAAAGGIAGRVTNGGVGVANASVLALEGFYFAQTDAQGFYEITGADPGAYTVRLFNTGSLAPEVYNNSYTIAGATPVVVSSGATTQNINFDLAVGGSITGVIRDPNGIVLQDARVYMSNETWFFNGVSGPGGVFTISGVAPGTYTVSSFFDGYAETWRGQTFTPVGATSVAVSSGGTTSGVDIEHLLLGSISGSVLNVPVNGAFVSVEPLDCCPGGPGVSVSVDGPYAIAGVQPGCYRVAASAFPFDTQYSDAHFVAELADPVCVDPGTDRPDIDFVLRNQTPDFFEELIPLAPPADDARSTSGASLELSEPQPCGAIGATIWYRFALPPEMAPGTQVEVDTAGSSFDTVVAVSSGNHILSPPGGIAPVTCNDNAGTPQARAVFTGTPGGTYYVQLGGASGATGNAVLHIECIGDVECDGDADGADNCPAAYNPDQADLDGDVFGDVCDADPDGDSVPTTIEHTNGTEALVADTDGDGCSDSRETENYLPQDGGYRDPLNYWDFYDVTGDGLIDLQDTLLVLEHFGESPGHPDYDRKFDRFEPDAAQPWRTAQTQSGFIIDLIDALVSLDSFGHNCN